MSKPTPHDYEIAAIHLLVLLVIWAALGVVGWYCGTHGWSFTGWDF